MLQTAAVAAVSPVYYRQYWEAKAALKPITITDGI